HTPKPALMPNSEDKDNVPPIIAGVSPITMVLRPPLDHPRVVPERFPGELPESFESTMATVKRRPAAARGIGAILRRLIGPLSGRLTSDRADSGRSVVFDGYRGDLYDEKRE